MLVNILSAYSAPEDLAGLELKMPSGTRIELVRETRISQLLDDMSLDEVLRLNRLFGTPNSKKYTGIFISCKSFRVRGVTFKWSIVNGIVVVGLEKGQLPLGITLKVQYSRLFNFGPDVTFTVTE